MREVEAAMKYHILLRYPEAYLPDDIAELAAAAAPQEVKAALRQALQEVRCDDRLERADRVLARAAEIVGGRWRVLGSPIPIDIE